MMEVKMPIKGEIGKFLMQLFFDNIMIRTLYRLQQNFEWIEITYESDDSGVEVWSSDIGGHGESCLHEECPIIRTHFGATSQDVTLDHTVHV